MFISRYVKRLLVLSIVIAAVVAGQFASAALLPITNPSFEAHTIPEGQDFTGLTIGWNGWSATPYTLSNSGTPQRFPDGIPDGNQAGATVNPIGVTNSALYQFLHELVLYEPNTIYTLSGYFGYDATAVNSNLANAGGKLELYSGSDSWATPWITIEFGLDELPVGGFTFASAKYITGETGGALGGAMLVRAQGYSTATNEGQFCLDDIQLDAAPLRPGDINLDGKVDDVDATILAANWGWTGGATWSNGDFNNDGNVNDVDAAMMADNWLAHQNVASLSSVPEPGSIVLLGLGMLSMLLLHRKR